MTKQDTRVLKGVAILLMVFLHLFMLKTYADECVNFFNIGDLPLVHWLSRAANPVNFFLLLSGYGMHYIYSRGGRDKNRFSRIVRLYVHRMVCFILFASIGDIIDREYYVDFQEFMYNVIGWNTTMYPPGWFLFPFACLSLLAPCIFKFTDKFDIVVVVVGSFLFGTLTSFILSRYGEQCLTPHQWLKNLFLIFHLAPAFIWGGMLHRVSSTSQYLNNSILESLWKKWWVWILLLILVVARCIVNTAAWGPIYACAFTLLFLATPRWSWVDKILAFLGDHSMNIWFIHLWLFGILFKEEYLMLRYPVVIYIAVVFSSVACSYIINLIVRGIYRCVPTNIRK